MDTNEKLARIIFLLKEIDCEINNLVAELEHPPRSYEPLTPYIFDDHLINENGERTQ
jgi:hypothetical protein